MRFRKTETRKRTFPRLNADFAFKCYVLVALLSTSGLDTLLFVTVMLLALVATLELTGGLVRALFFFSNGARRPAQLEADGA